MVAILVTIAYLCTVYIAREIILGMAFHNGEMDHKLIEIFNRRPSSRKTTELAFKIVILILSLGWPFVLVSVIRKIIKGGPVNKNNENNK